METPANAWWTEMRREAEAPTAEPERRVGRAVAVGGGIVAAVLAAGLGWWVTTSEPTTFVNRESALAQPQVMPAVIPTEVDLEQLRRAREEFAATYAATGVGGIERVRMNCDASARTDARLLDFCLALDLMAETVVPDASAPARRLALVEAAVPGEPAPIRRVEAVRTALQSMGALGAPPPVQDAPSPRQAPAIQSPAQSAPPARIVVAKAKPAPAKAAPSRCAGLPTAADRLVCGSPALKSKHERMRAAYDAALKAGADPLAIDRGQAEWRASRNAASSREALASLYDKRIAQLRSVAEEARLTPPN